MIQFIIFFFIFNCYFNYFNCFQTSNCSLNGEGIWSVGIVTGSNLYNLKTPYDNYKGQICQRNPIISCIDINNIPAAFVADPFLYVEDNLASNPWYAFYEVKNMNSTSYRRRGQIGLSISNDQGFTWKYHDIIILGDVHLSYPFVFKYKNDYYLMPQGKSISYWKATRFPYEWAFHSQVHKRILNDATIIEYKGKWWLFALFEPNRNKDDWFLHILYSNSPLGPWNDTSHNCWPDPLNSTASQCIGANITTPHYRGRLGVRPGGHMFVHEGKLYRMVQNSLHLYGDSMDLYHITHLSVNEKLEDVILPEFQKSFRTPRNIENWSDQRYHQIDLHYLKYPNKHYQWVGLFDGDYNNGHHVREKEIIRCADFL